jgi:hypothetical protein
MPDQTCLRRHLLYASVQAYHPRSPSYSSAPPRWLAPPLEIDAPRIDFALAGRFAEGIVIAFRGTLPPLDPAQTPGGSSAPNSANGRPSSGTGGTTSTR